MRCPRVLCKEPDMLLVADGTYRCSVLSCGAEVILSESAAVAGLTTVSKHGHADTPNRMVFKPTCLMPFVVGEAM